MHKEAAVHSSATSKWLSIDPADFVIFGKLVKLLVVTAPMVHSTGLTWPQDSDAFSCAGQF